MSLFELFHYLIGLVFVFLLVWLIIYIHTYFSKDNIPITTQTITEQFVSNYRY